MSRSLSVVGLNDRAKSIWEKTLEDAGHDLISSYLTRVNHATNEITFKKWSDKKYHALTVEYESIEVWYGDTVDPIRMFVPRPNENPLNLIEEYIQEIRHSSGPVVFLALRSVDTQRPIESSLWTESEMYQYE